MRLDNYLLPVIALALLIVAGCHPVDDPGGLLEPLSPEDGLVAQANLDGSVTLPGAVEQDEPVAEPEVTPPEVVEPQTPATLILEPLGDDGEAGVAGTEDPVADETAGDPLAPVDDDDSGADDADSGAVVAGEAVQPPAEDEPAVEEVADSAVEPESAPVDPPATPEPVDPQATPLPVETPAAPIAAPEPPPTPAPVVEDLLPEPPASDADAIAAIDALDRAEAPPAPILVPGPDELAAPPKRCEPLPPLQAHRIDEYVLVDVGRHGLIDYALIRDPEGGEHQVGLGDRLGPDGGKITRIERSSVVVGEISFDQAGSAFISVRTIRLLAQ